MNVGKTIFEQIKTITPTAVIWSWGASSWKSFGEEYFQDIPHLGGLLFKVRGQIHTGHVMIQLAPDDTYVVSTGKLYAGQFRKITTHKNVYFDELPSLLDEMIETPPVAQTA